MTAQRPPLRLGFFTRILDQAPPAERYRLAVEQIRQAERCGFDSAWIAQHHFHADEGGLPAPFVFLAQAAAATTRIRLGTGIVTLPLELPIRVAEDAAVLDLMCGERLEVGIGPGGNLSAFRAFGLDAERRGEFFSAHRQVLVDAWSGRELPGGDRLHPDQPGLVDRIWQATFTVEGARRAGAAGDGLMLSRTQPRPPGQEDAPLDAVQNPMVDAYLAALPAGRAPRIMASRTVFVADDAAEAERLVRAGYARHRERLLEVKPDTAGASLDALIAQSDIHAGTPEAVIRSLAADTVITRATELAVQVHSVDPPHALTMRSIALMAERVAPAFGWQPPADAMVRVA